MARFTGWHTLPELSEKDVENLESGQHHKVAKTEHVQAMQQLIDESYSTPPGELEGSVLAYDLGPGQMANQGYALITKASTRDAEVEFKLIQYLDGNAAKQYARLLEMDYDDLLRERAAHQPDRSQVRV